jgi:predicted MFS family arabinose efflux permease
VLAATALMALMMGTRSAFSLFVSPLNTATGIGLAGLGLAIAFGQLGLGLAQPALGWLADRFGPRRVIATGAWTLAVATAALSVSDTLLVLSAVLIVMAVAGGAVGSNTLLLAEVGRRVPLERRALAFGIVSAGGSVGQLILGPATQFTIESQGWVAAVCASALLSLVALPLSRALGDSGAVTRPATPSANASSVRESLRSLEFWLCAGSFGICGFHIAFMTTHMPGVIERCGLPVSLAGAWLAVLGAANIVGSLAAAVWLRRHSAHTVLISVFALRALSIVALLVLPVSPVTMLGFAVLMGLSYMALLPAISQQAAERFGTERLATMFGVMALVHQIGSFAGAWLGGVAAEATGNDTLMWSIDIALALLAIAFQCQLAWGNAMARILNRRSLAWPAGADAAAS